MDFVESNVCTVELAGFTLYLNDIAVPLYVQADSYAFVGKICSEDSLVPNSILDQVMNVEEDHRGRLSSLIHKYDALFDERHMGCVANVCHEIHLPDECPVKQMPRRVPIAQRDVIEEEVQNMLDNDIIEPSSSNWTSPIVLVRKKDNSYTLCIDYRKLNAQTRIDAFPLPNTLDILDNLHSSKYFAAPDMKGGFCKFR
jgi:hypothetical protein